MIAPLFKYGLFGDELSLVVAFITGIAFGFVLERAGFGNARVLAAQFYFRDLRVLKVMFTAIATAMLGVYVLARVGWLDLSLVYLTPTLVGPQIVGGLLLGAGFIIGGYCPGTSCVSAATGRIDGMVYVAGMVGGLLGFAEVYPHIAAFAHATALGQVTIPAYFNVSYGVVVLLVVLMALGAFAAAEWAERRIGGRRPEAGALLEPVPGMTPVRRFAAVLVGLGVFAAFAGNPYRGSVVTVDAKQLALDASSGANRRSANEVADALITRRENWLLVDVRGPAAFAGYHLPGATNVPAATLTPDFASRSERIVCYGDDDASGVEAALVLRSFGFRGAYGLTGGLEAWRNDVLFPAAPAADATAASQAEFARRAAMARHFGGAPRGADTGPAKAPELPRLAPAPAAAPGAPVATPRRKKEGC